MTTAISAGTRTSATTGTEIGVGLMMQIFVSLCGSLQASECRHTEFGRPEANGWVKPNESQLLVEVDHFLQDCRQAIFDGKVA